MAAADSPDWLPAGWTMQTRVQKTGREIRYYTNLGTGQKFFSKDDVIRCTKLGTAQKSEPQLTNRHSKEHSETKRKELVVKTTERPEWLPDGWIMEVKTGKSNSTIGKKVKVYIDTSSGHKCYSKPEVLGYRKSLNRQTSASKRKKTGISVHPARKVVIERSTEDDLPPGWIKEVKVTENGYKTRRDPFYTDPVSGYVFRSKKDVLRYLKTGEISMYAVLPKKRCINDQKLTNNEALPSSEAKRQKLEDPATRRQLFEGEGWYCMSSIPLTEDEAPKQGQDERVSAEGGLAISPTAEVLAEKHSIDKADEMVVAEDEAPKQGQDERVSAEGGLAISASAEVLAVKHSIDKADEIVVAEDEAPKQGQDERVSAEGGLAISPTAEILAEKHSIDKADEIIVAEDEAPKQRQDKRVSAEGGLAISASAEVLAEKHSIDKADEIVVETKANCSLSRSARPKAEGTKRNHISTAKRPVSALVTDILPEKNLLESRLEKINGTKTEKTSNKSKNKKDYNMPRRSSKRLARIEPESEADGVSTGQALPNTTRKEGATQQLKAGPEMEVSCDDSADVSTPSNKSKEPLENQAILGQPQLETSITIDNKSEPPIFLPFGDSSLDPCLEFAFKTLTGAIPVDDIANHGPISTPVADILQEKNSHDSRMEGSRSGKARKIKKKELMPRRSSKQLDGAEGNLVANSMSGEKTLGITSRKSSSSEANLNMGLNSVDGASQHPEAGLRTRLAHHNSWNINDSSHELSSKSKLHLEGQNVHGEKPQELENRETNNEQTQPQPIFPFGDSWSDPCIEFAFKTLTGAIPVEDNSAIQDYFQQQFETSRTQRNSNLALPAFGLPYFPQSDIPSRIDGPEKQPATGQQLPPNSSFLHQANVSLPSCSGIGSQKHSLDGTKEMQERVKSKS